MRLMPYYAQTGYSQALIAWLYTDNSIVKRTRGAAFIISPFV
jgi:hypothetical protein